MVNTIQVGYNKTKPNGAKMVLNNDIFNDHTPVRC